MKGMIMSRASGGAVSASRASRLMNAATRYAGRCLGTGDKREQCVTVLAGQPAASAILTAPQIRGQGAHQAFLAMESRETSAISLLSNNVLCACWNKFWGNLHSVQE